MNSYWRHPRLDALTVDQVEAWQDELARQIANRITTYRFDTARTIARLNRDGVLDEYAAVVARRNQLLDDLSPGETRSDD